MSCTEIYAVMPESKRKFAFIEEFANSHGGAFFIWDALVLKYRGGPLHSIDYSTKRRRIWDLAGYGALSLRDEAVLKSTLGRAVVQGDDIMFLSDQFDKFAEEHHVGEMANRDCSLREQAEVLRGCAKDGALYVAWNQASVGEFWGKGCVVVNGENCNVVKFNKEMEDPMGNTGNKNDGRLSNYALREVFSVTPDNLASKQYDILKAFAVSKLREVAGLIEDDKLSKAQAMTFESPAGDDIGCDNCCIDFDFTDGKKGVGFGYRRDGCDICTVLDKLEELASVTKKKKG